MKPKKPSVTSAAESSEVKQKHTQSQKGNASIIGSLKIEKEDKSAEISTRRG
jgi:hypothetical protein